jgi:5'-phosphate synthase pdxT subunit
MKTGVLAFHGDVAEHMEMLQLLKAEVIEVRTLEDLAKVDRIIIPGGESTVMAHFLELTGVGKEMQRRVKNESLAVYGTCAGAILLANKITGRNAPRGLGLIKMTVERNAYGTQLQSFASSLKIKGLPGSIDASFIRAPVISSVGKEVETLASLKNHPVLVRQGRLLAGTFHPEMRGETALHRLFLKL